MKALRLAREKSGSSAGKKKRTDKQLKQKTKEEKNAADQIEEIALAAPYFVDASCERLDTSLPHLTEKLLGCGQRVYLGLPGCELDWLDEPCEWRWGIVGTLPARHADKLTAAEHQQLLDNVAGKQGVQGVVTGVEYGKPPHGEARPCAPSEPQRDAFEVHVKTALKWNVPIVLVIRPEAREEEDSDRAVKDALAWLTEFGVPEDYRIYFSSWLGSPLMAIAALKKFKNAYLGLNAAVTFRASAHLREIAFDTPLPKLLLESSAPLNPPMNQVLPHSPWTIITVAECVAEQKRMTTDELLIATNANAATFFGKALKEPKVEEPEAAQPVPAKKTGGKNSNKGNKKNQAAAAEQDKDSENNQNKEVGEVDEELELEELKKFLE